MPTHTKKRLPPARHIRLHPRQGLRFSDFQFEIFNLKFSILYLPLILLLSCTLTASAQSGPRATIERHSLPSPEIRAQLTRMSSHIPPDLQRLLERSLFTPSRADALTVGRSVPDPDLERRLQADSDLSPDAQRRLGSRSESTPEERERLHTASQPPPGWNASRRAISPALNRYLVRMSRLSPEERSRIERSTESGEMGGRLKRYSVLTPADLALILRRSVASDAERNALRRRSAGTP